MVILTLILLYLLYFFPSFITYRSCKHLNNKHTIFGRLVGGMETLTEMEKIEVDNKDKPIENIVLIKAQVFVNPFEEADEQVIFSSLFLVCTFNLHIF
jgi:hypothetical protein